MPSLPVDLVVVALGTPLLVGVYENGQLVEKIESDKKTSDALPKIFQDILRRYEIERIFFARGPGSFMSIKLVYIFLQTLKIARGFKLYGCEGFEFTQGGPIKAVGNLYFVKENDAIVTKPVKNVQTKLDLPQSLEELRCDEKTSPLYVIPAV